MSVGEKTQDRCFCLLSGTLLFCLSDVESLADQIRQLHHVLGLSLEAIIQG